LKKTLESISFDYRRESGAEEGEQENERKEERIMLEGVSAAC